LKCGAGAGRPPAPTHLVCACSLNAVQPELLGKRQQFSLDVIHYKYQAFAGLRKKIFRSI
jgi:hypothetical protein